ncbi:MULTISPECIES: aspartyl-phosphate phosphatase Spo0E family protein [unclassified Oceanobacillus]|uniref:aspartyl-phosphate phosphatase Spo0E family protein n=1 Tax=unclassified Oceanobacillus TaxID=2630292 RepID=UPI00300DEBF5
MDTLMDMLKQIEVLRKEMIQTAEENGLNHEKCITISKELDQLLNEYERVKQMSSPKIKTKQ